MLQAQLRNIVIVYEACRSAHALASVAGASDGKPLLSAEAVNVLADARRVRAAIRLEFARPGLESVFTVSTSPQTSTSASWTACWIPLRWALSSRTLWTSLVQQFVQHWSSIAEKRCQAITLSPIHLSDPTRPY